MGDTLVEVAADWILWQRDPMEVWNLLKIQNFHFEANPEFNYPTTSHQDNIDHIIEFCIADDTQLIQFKEVELLIWKLLKMIIGV